MRATGTPATSASPSSSTELPAVTFNVFWRHLLRHPELRRPDVSLGLLSVRNARYNIALVVYPVATLLGLLSLPLFLALMLALAGMFLLPTTDVRSRIEAPPGDPG